jgi:hypothetical protein
MKLLLLRDEETTSDPAPAQVSVGELVMNSVTGKLYTKLTDGTLVEFISQKVCYAPLPEISFSNTSNICCYGSMIYANIKNLQPEPKTYIFNFEELTGNSNSGSISSPSYTSYTVSGTAGLPSGQSVTLREAIVPITINIGSPNNINIFKFSIYSDNIQVTEKILPLSCNVCS